MNAIAASSRLQGLAAPAAQLVIAGMAALQRQDAAAAEQALRAALRQAPQHAEIMRLLAIALRLLGREVEALALSRMAAERLPDDALVQAGLGTSLDLCGDGEAAIAAFRRACALAPDAAELWHNLGKTLCDRDHFEEAVPVIERALALRDLRKARVRLARALRILGRIDDAAASYRELLARNPADGDAWLGLANLKTRPFAEPDLTAMRNVLARAPLSEDDRISVSFALAKAEEDLGHYPAAFATLTRANALTRRIRPWNAAEFSAHVDAVLAAFPGPLAGAPNGQGDDVIFIVSIPRSGSTLTEQILASHPAIEGAGELDALTAVITGESVRRDRAFPAWVASATPQDWQRLGQEYLERTTRWRQSGKSFTDKLPGNWLRVGAALAMLPGARVIDCRRDPVESCFSCFRQLFSEGTQAFSYDMNDVAAYWREYDRSMRHWLSLFPTRIREQHYEALVAEPERQIAQLLEFCGVPFDPVCLDYTRTRRSVRTASASQVREPLMRDTARAPKYGALLDPLRRALAS